MTATQAPTPGPLSVGDRVVAVADLRKLPDGPVWVKKGEEVGIVREYGVGNCIAGVALQDGREGDWAKSCFRLAPTAPVEASGSEREHGPKCWGKTSFSDEMMYCYCGSTENRPQPSGETQEALDRMKMAAHVYEDDEMAADCATLEALLSARPLALGGQQGGIPSATEATLVAYEDAHAVAVEMGYPSLTEALEHLSELTTPTRAETKDEGAAGEPVAWRKRPSGQHPLFRDDFTDVEWRVSNTKPDLGEGNKPEWFDVQPLYAHPSPTPAADAPDMIEATATKRTTGETRRIYINRTEGKVYEIAPAADADRVRIAVAALEKIAHGPWPQGLESAEDQVAFDEAVSKQALAALKSTAAKEGEK